MFEYNGYKVKQVINITDIGHLSSDADDGEDKMTKALKREGKPLTLEAMRNLADFYFEKFKEDLTDLNIELPTEFPFASENIKEDISLIEKLSEKGFVYTTPDGLYFDISKYPEYGKLGNIKTTENNESRIGINPEKRNLRDFAVWKFSAQGGSASGVNSIGYDAPFGKGFPGWHIECSAMSVKYLGPEFDIHTGGIDHIPVHHNNEIAQSVCAGFPSARYWMHNAFLTMGTEKMAKSEENFITLQTLKDRGIDPLAYRYLLLTAQYSSPLQFSWEALEGASSALKKLRKILQQEGNIVRVKEFSPPTIVYKEKFISYINDNLDTPKALALIWELTKDKSIPNLQMRNLLWDFDRILGLHLDKVELFEIPQNVKNLIKERDLARNSKDFTKSDEIRKKIEDLGFEVKDTPEETIVIPR
jgi:cysteinyl-tRNA synthetase